MADSYGPGDRGPQSGGQQNGGQQNPNSKITTIPTAITTASAPGGEPLQTARPGPQRTPTAGETGLASGCCSASPLPASPSSLPSFGLCARFWPWTPGSAPATARRPSGRPTPPRRRRKTSSSRQTRPPGRGHRTFPVRPRPTPRRSLFPALPPSPSGSRADLAVIQVRPGLIGAHPPARRLERAEPGGEQAQAGQKGGRRHRAHHRRQHLGRYFQPGRAGLYDPCVFG